MGALFKNVGSIGVNLENLGNWPEEWFSKTQYLFFKHVDIMKHYVFIIDSSINLSVV